MTAVGENMSSTRSSGSVPGVHGSSAQISELVRTIGTLRDQILILKKEITDSRTDLIATRELFENMKKQYDEVVANNRALTARISQLSQTVTTFQREADERKAAVDKAREAHRQYMLYRRR